MSIFLPDHEAFIQSLPERQQSFVVGNLLLYVFRGCQQADVRTSLEERKIRFDFLGWRRHLHHNGLLLRDGKLYVYAKMAKAPLCDKTHKLSETDLELLHAGLRYPPLRAHLRELQQTESCRLMTVRQFDRFVGKVLTSDDLLTYTRKFIHRKFHFVMRSYGMELDDIENRLKSNALYGLQRAYPRFEHVGHGVAIAKTLIKRSGINFIQELTTQKQNQLIHDVKNNTYSKTTVSLDAIADGTGQFLTADGTFVHRSLLVVGLAGANTFGQLPWDTLHALKELVNSNRLKTKQREFLGLMLGNYSEQFSEFLGGENDSLVESLSYNAYMKKVCEYLSVPLEAATHFLQNLAPQLGGNMHTHLND